MRSSGRPRFRRAGARPAPAAVNAYIDAHRDEYGVEPDLPGVSGRRVGLLRGETAFALRADPPRRCAQGRDRAGVRGQPRRAFGPPLTLESLRPWRAASTGRQGLPPGRARRTCKINDQVYGSRGLPARPQDRHRHENHGNRTRARAERPPWLLRTRHRRIRRPRHRDRVHRTRPRRLTVDHDEARCPPIERNSASPNKCAAPTPADCALLPPPMTPQVTGCERILRYTRRSRGRSAAVGGCGRSAKWGLCAEAQAERARHDRSSPALSKEH